MEGAVSIHPHQGSRVVSFLTYGSWELGRRVQRAGGKGSLPSPEMRAGYQASVSYKVVGAEVTKFSRP